MQQVEDKQLGQLSDAHLEKRFEHQRSLMNCDLRPVFPCDDGIRLAFLSTETSQHGRELLAAP